MRDGRQQVIILYSHPLLGEGLGRLLAADPNLLVELIRVDDLEQAERALTCSPDVVILERTAPVQAIDLMRFAPSALVIDVGLDAGPTWTWRRDELAPQPEELLKAIHGRDGHTSPPGAQPAVAPSIEAAIEAALETALQPAPAQAGVVVAATGLRSAGA